MRYAAIAFFVIASLANDYAVERVHGLRLSDEQVISDDKLYAPAATVAEIVTIRARTRTAPRLQSSHSVSHRRYYVSAMSKMDTATDSDDGTQRKRVLTGKVAVPKNYAQRVTLISGWGLDETFTPPQPHNSDCQITTKVYDYAIATDDKTMDPVFDRTTTLDVDEMLAATDDKMMAPGFDGTTTLDVDEMMAATDDKTMAFDFEKTTTLAINEMLTETANKTVSPDFDGTTAVAVDEMLSVTANKTLVPDLVEMTAFTVDDMLAEKTVVPDFDGTTTLAVDEILVVTTNKTSAPDLGETNPLLVDEMLDTTTNKTMGPYLGETTTFSVGGMFTATTDVPISSTDTVIINNYDYFGGDVNEYFNSWINYFPLIFVALVLMAYPSLFFSCKSRKCEQEVIYLQFNECRCNAKYLNSYSNS